jgi:uncharacterized protein
LKDRDATSSDLEALAACYEQVIYDLSEENARLQAQARRQKKKKTKE